MEYCSPGIPATVYSYRLNIELASRRDCKGCIRNNSSFRQKHPGVPDGSDGSDRTSNHLTENYTLPVTQAMGRVAYIPLLLISKMHFGHWECLRVVGPEPQGGQIAEFTGVM